MKLRILVWIILTALVSASCQANEANKIRIGVLAFGTLAWEIAAMTNEPSLHNAAFELQSQTLANPQAAELALRSGSVDMIVADWIWTSRMRTSGTQLSFYPYSAAAGALVVPANSPIKTLKDLNHKRLGIAGGELDKNWLLLQALAQQQQLDLQVEKIFAAPPLLNQQLLQGHVDALLNYWPFAAQLESQGYRQVLDSAAILSGLGIQEQVPNLGYVFNEAWANEHKSLLKTFLSVSQQAKDKLCTEDAVWQKIIPLTKAEIPATQKLLRERYCVGRVKAWGEKQQQVMVKLYRLLQQVSHKQLTGDADTLQSGTFWNVD